MSLALVLLPSQKPDSPSLVSCLSSLSTSSSFAYPTGPPTLQGPNPPSHPPFYSLGSTNLALIVVPASLGLVLLLALGWYVFRRQKIRIGRRRSFGTSTTTTTMEEEESREEGDVPSSPLEKFRSIFRSSQPTQDGGRPADGNDDDDGGSSVRWDPIPPLPGPSPAYTPTTRSLAGGGGGGGMRSEEELGICWAREVRRATEIAHPPPSAPPSSSSPPLSSAGVPEGTVGSLVEEREEGDDDGDGRSTLRSFEIVCSPAYYLEYDPSCRPGSEIIFLDVPSAGEEAGGGGGEGGGGESTEGGGTSSTGHLLRGEKEAERSG